MSVPSSAGDQGDSGPTARAVFLDLNGTLIEPVRPQRLAEHTVVPGVARAVRRLREHGFLCPVITVQSGITRGRFSLDEFMAWFAAFARAMRAEGAELLGPYVCPHISDAHCECHKPKTHLYRTAAVQWGIDVRRSVVVGDTASDLRAARSLGCQSILVRTGWGEGSVERAIAEELADYVAADITDAANWIVQRTDRVV